MQRSCLILGAGRSGTSLLAGVLSKADYFMGDRLHPAADANPKGFFEDAEVNAINEELLAQVLPKRARFIGRWIHRRRLMLGGRWLARIPLDTKIPPAPQLVPRIQQITSRAPFCLKDPRFSYTLPVWRPHIGDAVFLCVFRDPASSATSMLKECRGNPNLRRLVVTHEDLIDTWVHNYRHTLERHRHEGKWLFLHFNQLLTEEGLDRVAEFTGALVDRSFPDPSLRRSQGKTDVGEPALEVYEELCSLAGYAEPPRAAATGHGI